MSAMLEITTLPLQPLTRAGFAAYGELIDTEGGTAVEINDGSARRFDALAQVAFEAPATGVGISIFVAARRPLPMEVTTLERHPLGAQAFMPLDGRPYLVVVADDQHDGPVAPRAFFARGDQGICFGPGVWHHPLIALHDDSRFLVVDAIADDGNLAIGRLTAARYRLPAVGPSGTL
ncbi:MAG: ureidoglycolate lyase [Burkholderiaceae bacterium]